MSLRQPRENSFRKDGIFSGFMLIQISMEIVYNLSSRGGEVDTKSFVNLAVAPALRVAFS